MNLKAKHLAIILPAILVAGIGVSIAFGWWNAATGGHGGGMGRGAGQARGAGEGRGLGEERGAAEADVPAGLEAAHDPSDRLVRGTTTFQDLARWGVDAADVARLTGGELGAPEATVREWCASRGIGFGTVKTRIQALVDAAAP